MFIYGLLSYCLRCAPPAATMHGWPSKRSVSHPIIVARRYTIGISKAEAVYFMSLPWRLGIQFAPRGGEAYLAALFSPASPPSGGGVQPGTA